MDPNVSFKSPKSSPYSHKQNETLVIQSGTLNGTELTLTNLLNCDVFVMDYTSVVVVENCSNSRIRIGPVAGFCHLRSCIGCTISVAARDVELNRCTSTTLLLYSMNNPHIENTSGLLVGPYNYAYPEQDRHFQKAGLGMKVNSWDKITDHTADDRLTNWAFLPQQDWEEVTYGDASTGKPVNPVAKPKVASSVKEPRIQMGSKKSNMFHQQSPKAASNTDDPVPDDLPDPIVLTDISLNPVGNRGKDQSYLQDETRHVLTEVEPLEVVRIYYTRDEEFLHEFALPHVGVGTSMIVGTLQKASRVAAKFYDDMDLVIIGEFTVLSMALLLALVIVLLHIFVEIYGPGLAVELFLVTVMFVVLLVLLIRKQRLILSQGNLEMSKLLEHETKTLYSSQGVELRGDLSLLEVVVSSIQ